MKNRCKKGFTLAELLIVVAVLGILLTIAFPYINTKFEKAREAHDIATMRQAASAAVLLYYSGVNSEASAKKAGLSWNTGDGKRGTNAYGAYDPKTGTLVESRDKLPSYAKKYGKGTATDGGTTFVSGNDEGAYVSTLDYRNAVVMVSIYPLATPAHIDVYWKNNDGKDIGKYVGGSSTISSNAPKYCMRINLG